jgi:hypothetical protein
MLGTGQYDGEGRSAGIPSHHDAESLDLLEIQGLGIFLQFSAVSRVEAVPRNEDGSVFGVTGDGLRRQVEVAFPRDGGLLATGLRVAR